MTSPRFAVLALFASVFAVACASQPISKAAPPRSLIVVSTGTGLALEASPEFPPATFNAKREMRAGWIVGWRQMISTAAIDDAIGMAEAAGLNTLFVQVRVNADAYYRSELVPRAESLQGQPAEFDPLGYALKRGHEKGFQVHAWANLGIVWRSTTPPSAANHIFNAHPDWVLRDANGKMSTPRPDDPQPGYVEENFWINWGHSEAQKHLAKVSGEIARRYRVDGIHFDFVRFPARMGPRTVGVGYDPVSVGRFKAETGREPAEHTQAWDEWRFAQVTATLKSCHEAILRARPATAVSAAVLAAWNLAYGRNFTGYRGWIDSGLLDFAVLMSYYKDRTQIWQSVLNAREIVDSRRVVMGLDISAVSPETAARVILFSREQDLKGYSLFALDHIVLKDPYPYLSRFKSLAAAADDGRYKSREPLWNRVAVVDDEHRTFALRFYSRTGKTKLVVYPRGLTKLSFSLNDREFAPLTLSGIAPVAIDLSPWLEPEKREIMANHDFTLNATVEGPPDSFGEIFTVDYYGESTPAR